MGKLGGQDAEILFHRSGTIIKKENPKLIIIQSRKRVVLNKPLTWFVIIFFNTSENSWSDLRCIRHHIKLTEVVCCC